MCMLWSVWGKVDSQCQTVTKYRRLTCSSLHLFIEFIVFSVMWRQIYSQLLSVHEYCMHSSVLGIHDLLQRSWTELLSQLYDKSSRTHEQGSPVSLSATQPGDCLRLHIIASICVVNLDDNHRQAAVSCCIMQQHVDIAGCCIYKPMPG